MLNNGGGGVLISYWNSRLNSSKQLNSSILWISRVLIHKNNFDTHNKIYKKIKNFWKNTKLIVVLHINQTKRQFLFSLNMRIKEHFKDINKKSGCLTVISDHRLSTNHEFTWDNVCTHLRPHEYLHISREWCLKWST